MAEYTPRHEGQPTHPSNGGETDYTAGDAAVAVLIGQFAASAAHDGGTASPGKFSAGEAYEVGAPIAKLGARFLLDALRSAGQLRGEVDSEVVLRELRRIQRGDA